MANSSWFVRTAKITVGKHVGKQLATNRACGCCQSNKTRGLFTWLNFSFKFIEEVHNCPAVRDVSSIAYKDTKNEQSKMEELPDKLGFVRPFYFSTFAWFFPSLLLVYCSTRVPVHQRSRPCFTLPRVVWFDSSLTCEGMSLPTVLLKFSNTSLPTKVCRVKVASGVLK